MNTPKYTARTEPAHNGAYYASYARLIPHTYGAHTAHGKRTVMRPGFFVEVGKFPTRKEALAAARAAIQAKINAMPKATQA
jgi:hypothetical protein